VDGVNEHELLRDKDLVRAMVEGSRASHYKRIAQLLKQDPQNPFWAFALRPGRDPINPRVEKLAAEWLRLNVNNANLHFINMFSDSHSPAILGQLFKWMQSGGLSSRRMPRMIDDFVRSVARYHEPIRPHVIEFVREWLKTNSEDEYAGRAYGVVFSTTRLNSDIRKAKVWYSRHKDNEHAWEVIAALLEISYWDSTVPDQYAIDEARTLLQQEEQRTRRMRLIAGLVSVCPDEQSIFWAKEVCERLGQTWILLRLLQCAPDPSIHLLRSRWIDGSARRLKRRCCMQYLRLIQPTHVHEPTHNCGQSGIRTINCIRKSNQLCEAGSKLAMHSPAGRRTLIWISAGYPNILSEKNEPKAILAPMTGT